MAILSIAWIVGALALAPVGASAAELRIELTLPGEPASGTSFVRVHFVAETKGPAEDIEINGKKITGYQPTILHVFPATGIVMDDEGHVLTFLGYRWVDIPTAEARIEVFTAQAKKYRGKLVGVDQSTGVAVVRVEGVKLAKSPVCENCEVRDGTTVVTMVLEEKGESYHRARIVSVGSGRDASARGEWTMTINRPIPGVGEPLLNTEHKVLGFIASQRPSEQSSTGVQTIVYPMSQLLTSARRILRSGSDIHTGWLGVFLTDARTASGNGVLINGVEENSPAQRAGLLPRDVLLRWNGEEIGNLRQFIYLVQSSRVGSKVRMDVLREGSVRALTAEIAARRQKEISGRSVLPGMIAVKTPGLLPQTSAGHRALAGIDLATLSAELAEFLEVRGRTGLLVLNVESKSVFGSADVRVGDIILAVDGRRIADPNEFSAHIQTRGWGSRLLLSILRKGAERMTTVEIPASPAALPSERKP